MIIYKITNKINNKISKAKRSKALKGRKRPVEVIAKIKANHNPVSDLNLTHNRSN